MNIRTTTTATLRIVALFCCVGLAGCGPQFVTYNSISFLQKGLDQSSVHKKMDVSATNTITVVEKGQTYVLEYYPLQTAQSKSTSTTNSYGAFGQVTRSYSTTTITDHTNTLILLFMDRRLRYWGLLADYSKSEDPEIFALAPDIYVQFFKK